VGALTGGLRVGEGTGAFGVLFFLSPFLPLSFECDGFLSDFFSPFPLVSFAFLVGCFAFPGDGVFPLPVDLLFFPVLFDFALFLPLRKRLASAR
jgi:hypothetical protein